MEKNKLYQELVVCLNAIIDSQIGGSAFTSSIILDKHPLLSVKHAIKMEYYNALYYLATKQKKDIYVESRLEDYRIFFNIPSNCDEVQQNIKSSNRIIRTRFRPWRNKYQIWLLCDIALVLLEEQFVFEATKEIKQYVSKRQRKKIDILIDILFNEKVITKPFQVVEPFIEQYQRNRRHANLSQKKYIVMANMSAGKSTFINAIIGKPIARTSEEACTGNINYFYNKPFEDGSIHFIGDSFTFHARHQILTSFSWEKEARFSSFFRFFDNVESKICLVDTPGVNSAINKQHGSISKKIIQRISFDKVIYILNASKLGTEEEFTYIRWISEHVPHDKVIFVLNKLDNFKTGEDDISASIGGVRNDLLQFFENPIICPFSARFALLLKMKSYGDQLTLDEEDEYKYFSKKFKKPAYDLSKYYTCSYPNSKDESVLLSQKCGLYGLEIMLQGGHS